MYVYIYIHIHGDVMFGSGGPKCGLPHGLQGVYIYIYIYMVIPQTIVLPKGLLVSRKYMGRTPHVFVHTQVHGEYFPYTGVLTIWLYIFY